MLEVGVVFSWLPFVSEVASRRDCLLARGL
jgi:hypothetical protein